MTLDDLPVVCALLLSSCGVVCVCAGFTCSGLMTYLGCTLLSLTFSLHLDAVYTHIVTYTYMTQCVLVVLNVNKIF